MHGEENVLGAILLEPAAYFRVSDILSAEDFTSSANAAMWRAIERLHDAERPVDVFTVSEAMGGADAQRYAIDLASNTPGSSNVRAYAESVKAASTKRRVSVAGHAIAASGDLEQAQQLIGAIMDKQPGRLMTAKEANVAMFAGVSARYESGDDLAGLSTGIPELDELTGGLQRGRVYALGARAKMGKSILAWQIAAHVAVRLGKRVTGFSLEMQADELMQRMACCVGGVYSQGLQRPKLMDSEEWTKLSVAIKAISGSSLLLSDRMDITIDQIEAQARQSKPDLVVIDYLQLISQPKLETEAVRLAYITRRVKKLAKECDVPVIEVFQINRANEAGAIRAPRPSEARGSGTIEQDCDAMLLLHRPGYYDKSKDKGLSLDLALQRNGPTGVICMDEDLQRCRFLPSDRKWRPEPSRDDFDL